MKRYATSTLIFDLYAAPTEERRVPEPLRSDHRTVYPDAFDKHIIDTTERLKRRIDELHAKYAQPLPQPPPATEDRPRRGQANANRATQSAS
jgi:RNA processing factor Prp31